MLSSLRSPFSERDSGLLGKVSRAYRQESIEVPVDLDIALRPSGADSD
jgi:hypothetical protein